MIQRSLDDYTISLSHHLPNGDLWTSKNIKETVFYKLLSGLALIILEGDQKLQELKDEFYPATTTKFLAEWEELLGIPDDCISNTGSVEQRQKNILGALGALGAVTEEDWINLAAVMGFEITISHAKEGATFPLTLPFMLGSKRFLSNTIIINILNIQQNVSVFPLVLPFTLGENASKFLKCIFDRIKPATTNIIYSDDLPAQNILITEAGDQFDFESGDAFELEG